VSECRLEHFFVCVICSDIRVKMLRNGSFLRRAAAASLCSAVAFGFGCNASLSSTQAAQGSEISLRILKQLNAEQQAKLLAHPSFTTNAAVAILGPSPADSKDSGVRGSVVFVQPKSPDDAVIVRASITGLKPNSQHGFHIHTLGDLTKGCMSAGGHWNPFNAPHGAPPHHMPYSVVQLIQAQEDPPTPPTAGTQETSATCSLTPLAAATSSFKTRCWRCMGRCLSSAAQ
jgi:hypothetical protein